MFNSEVFLYSYKQVERTVIDAWKEQLKSVEEKKITEIEADKRKKLEEAVAQGALSEAQEADILREYDLMKRKVFEKECLKPTGYKYSEKEVFAYIYEDRQYATYNDRNREYHISLLTPGMAYVLYEYFKSDKNEKTMPWWDALYKPFSYEFSATLLNDDPVSNLLDRRGVNRWLLASISKPNESIDVPENTIAVRGILSYNGASSFYDEVILNIYEETEKESVLDRSEESYVESGLESIFTDVEGGPIEDMRNFINTSIDGASEYNVKVFNVGQANAVYISMNNGKAFFFDMGAPNKTYSVYNRSKKKRIYYSNRDYNLLNGSTKYSYISEKNGQLNNTINPDFVIISHWHTDHFDGYENYISDASDCVWIAPELTNHCSKSCFQLAKKLALKKRLYLFPDHYNKLLYNNLFGDIEIWGGKDFLVNGQREDNINNHGISIRIKNALFSGDSQYRCWNDNLKLDLDDLAIIVAPHHGSYVYQSDRTVLPLIKGKYTGSLIINGKVIQITSKKIAIISFGANGWKHPDQEHINELKKNDFVVYGTGGSKQNSSWFRKLKNIEITYNSIEFNI
ncbi:hypothetical protein [Butyrivibrio sp. FC2001]|uniref:hypothetical protein n=1 Tax=Butyrivibrio sp. FC2001 TaxID=1280671 RepID=UPI00040CAB95|nr:hypothetical protein [Butyrivibrio sp. FC2001]